MKNWKQYTAMLLAPVMIWAMVGCGETAQKEEEELTFRLAYVDTLTTLDPAQATTGLERTLAAHLFENLEKPTANGAVAGAARSFECTDNLDGTETYTFTLREGMKWSDGVPVTAGDFVYAWKRLVSPETESPHREILSVVAGYEQAADGSPEALQVSAEDDTTFVVQLNCHCPYFISSICCDAATMPVRQDIAERENWAQSKATLRTNGAYALDSWTEGSLTMSLAEDYYDSKRVSLDNMAFTFAADDMQALALYKNNEVDFVMGAGAEESSEAISLNESTYLVVNSMADNLRRESLRQAMSLVIDRNEIVAQQSAGCVAAEGLIPVGVPTTMGEGKDFREVNDALVDNDPEHYADKCEKAQELLHSGAVPFSPVTILCLDTPPQQRVAIQLQRMWQEQLELKVMIRSVAREEWQASLNGGEFAVALITSRPLINDAKGYLEDFASGSTKNHGLYSATAYDMLMRTAAQSGSAEARDAYLEDAERLLVESGYVMPLYSRETYYLLRENFTGVFDNGLGQCCFTGVTESKEG